MLHAGAMSAPPSFGRRRLALLGLCAAVIGGALALVGDGHSSTKAARLTVQIVVTDDKRDPKVVAVDWETATRADICYSKKTSTGVKGKSHAGKTTQLQAVSGGLRRREDQADGRSG